jgi:branched-chain amino acid transport system ATP-binding protein
MAEAPLVALQSVAVAFGALRAVDDVSLAVSRGERRAIIGPNGAGKTTLFNAIAGVLPTANGRIMLGGRDVTRLHVHGRAALGIARTFQITNLFAGLTVEENVHLAVQALSRRKFSLFGSGRPNAAEAMAIDEALRNCGLDEKRHWVTGTLSYGEQRRLELALALVSKPSVLLLDEPAAGLAPAERTAMADLIRSLPREVTLILIEHDMDLALNAVDFVTCLHFGRVLCEGAPEAIRSDGRVQEIYLGKPHADVAHA